MTRGVPLGMTPAERARHLAPQTQRTSGGGCLLVVLLVLAGLLLLWLT